MVSQNFDPQPITQDESGRVYSISSGSGGYKADFEKVSVTRSREGTYNISFLTPTSSRTVESSIESAVDAIERARDFAEQNVSVGMPGTGLIEAPPFDFSKVPDN